jgi:hypothetical protein
MALQIKIHDVTDYSRTVLLFSIHCDRMDRGTFLTMYEILLEEFEKLLHECTEMRMKGIFEKILHMFPDKVADHTSDNIDVYYTICDMILPGLILTRLVNGNLVMMRPYAEGLTRLHELYPCPM